WELAGPDMDRGVSVRLRSSNGIECTFVYFVGPDLRRNLPVLHLTLNPDFLFDHDSGIYVLGAHFQEWRDEFDPSQPWNTVGNFSQRGREWERPFVHALSDAVVMHYFSNDGQLAYSTPLGLRIHGATSRTFPMKALRLYARNEYGNRTFDYPFFGDDGPATHRRLLLRPAGSHCLCV